MPSCPVLSRAASRELGMRLFALRSRKGLRAADVARAAGVGRFSIAEYEHGHKTPSLGSLMGLARALDVDPGTLVRGLHKL